MSKFIISAGHTPSGTAGCGAVDLIDESVCTREVAKLVDKKLRALGHTSNLLIIDKGNSYNCEDCFVRSEQANELGADLYVEIHFNAGIERRGDGAEVLTISNSEIAKKSAERICEALSNDLHITNRGVKSEKLIVLSHTKMPAILIECMFVDGKDADSRYDAETIANAIVRGLTGQNAVSEPTIENSDKYYIVTNYLPNAYEGYAGVDINYVLSFFEGVKCYVRGNEKGIWIETQYLSKEKCTNLKNTLGSWFYSMEH